MPAPTGTNRSIKRLIARAMAQAIVAKPVARSDKARTQVSGTRFQVPHRASIAKRSRLKTRFLPDP